MTTITCQHSGLQFEAKSSRAKNHPALADVLSRANRDGRYGETIEAMNAIRNAGGYVTIDDFLRLVNERLAAARTHRQTADTESQRNFDKMKRLRHDRNELLKAAGYNWIGDWGPDNFDEYEEPSGRPPTPKRPG